MSGGDWYLKPIADFFLLLGEKGEAKDILQKRFKKDTDAHTELFQVIEKIDELGYEDGVDFAFAHRYMDTVKDNRSLGLIEIRVKKALWRVITYWDREKELFVMLDAFEHHKGKTMTKFVTQILPKVNAAEELLKEVEGYDHEDDAE